MTRQQTVSAVPVVSGRGLRVWHGRSTGASAADWAVLSREERERARRFLDPQERAHYVHAHAAVRLRLAELLDEAPEALGFGRWPCPRCGGTDHGPPRITHPPAAPHFNQSRSGADWLLATGSTGYRVGVDLERIRPLGDSFGGFLANSLTPEERAHVSGPDDPEERHRRFFRCWARKEAVLKAVGSGLTGGLARVHVRPWATDGTAVTFDGPGGGRFFVSDVPAPAGVAAAVAEELPTEAEGADAPAALPREHPRNSSERTVPRFINRADDAPNTRG